MKRIFKVTTVLALVLTVTTGFAKKSDIRLRTSKESKSLVLTMDKVSEDFTLKITDIQNNLLYFEEMDNSSLNKKFDLRGLQNGTYFLTTADATRTIVYTVAIDGDNVDILKKDETVKPYFRVTNEKLFVNFLNLDKSKVVIKVYDAEYRVVFSETVTEEMIIEKAFNFESAYKGSYRVVVSDTNETYAENFIVD